MNMSTAASLPNKAAFPGMPAAGPASNSEPSSGLFPRLWNWLCSFQVGRSSERRLQVADTVSLGDKRFVAVVQVDGRHFLVAGGPSNIALLAQLNEKDNFEDVLKRTMTMPEQVKVPEPVAAPQPVAKAVRKRITRPKKVARAVAVAPPSPAKAAARVPANALVSNKKMTAAVAGKKQPPAAARRSSKPDGPEERFGGIPAIGGGARAFDKWLGRTIPVASTRPAAVKVDIPRPSEAVPERAEVNAPASISAKQTLNEWLQETRTAVDKPLVQSIAEAGLPLAPPVTQPVTQPRVEEYA